MVTFIHGVLEGFCSGIMEQYLVLERKAFVGMKHFKMLETVKYEFQNNPKNERMPVGEERRTMN